MVHFLSRNMVIILLLFPLDLEKTACIATLCPAPKVST